MPPAALAKSLSPASSLADAPNSVPDMSTSTSVAGAGNSMPQTPHESPREEELQVTIKEDEDGMQVKGIAPAIEEPEEDFVAKHAQLKTLLDKSSVYAKLIGDRMRRQRAQKAQQEQRAATREENAKTKAATAAATGRRTNARLAAKKEGQSAEDTIESKPATGAAKRKRDAPVKGKSSGKQVEEEALALAAAAAQADDKPANGEAKDKVYVGEQPKLITGATLRDYQLAGVQWMVSLYENGLNGILADEMGLGKTLQTISFLAYLFEKGTTGPFLIVCPLSVLANWISEFEKFAPDIPVLMYHGTPPEREALRRDKMNLNSSRNLPQSNNGRNAGKLNISFPVIVTTYEMVIRDQKPLSKYAWKYIVVDEGHRLKNFDCLLTRQLKTYTSANRLILTGTPLHNNLAELWSLLNFILPNIFDNLDSFQKWFDFDEMNNGATGQSKVLDRSSIITSLHDILKPFLLRRLKEDVEPDLPPKKEYVLYAPLTQLQKDLYDAVASGGIRQYLIEKKTGADAGEEDADSAAEAVGDDSNRDRASGRLKKKPRISYKMEENDDKYVRDLENGKIATTSAVQTMESKIGSDWAATVATKQVNNMRLQNIVMQLRKVSNHPFLFDWPVNPETDEYVVNDDLVNASGKMLLLQRLLDALLVRGHRVLIFSQFTTMLNVIQDWLSDFKEIPLCRIDGSTSQADRLQQMRDFNSGRTDADAPKVFLLSTRAGGLGINLVSADTVIFFDQDWNPQQDLQAAARAHRIGQKNPVLIFRLISDHTVESKILQKAANKRKLEALVISQGKFGKIVNEQGEVLLDKKANRSESTAELARAMLELDSEAIRVVNKDDNIIADDDLDILLDRSEAAFARAPGWSTSLGQGRSKRKGNKAFEVYETKEDETNDSLAHMFGEKP